MPPREEVAEWLAKAWEDLEAAYRLSEPTPEPILAPAAFHCQQCAEKALKAYLVDRGVRFRKVHNLTYLHDLCQEAGLEAPELADPLARLIPFAVDERYPGARREPPADLVDELVEIAEVVLQTVESRIDAQS